MVTCVTIACVTVVCITVNYDTFTSLTVTCAVLQVERTKPQPSPWKKPELGQPPVCL